MEKGPWPGLGVMIKTTKCESIHKLGFSGSNTIFCQRDVRATPSTYLDNDYLQK